MLSRKDFRLKDYRDTQGMALESSIKHTEICLMPVSKYCKQRVGLAFIRELFLQPSRLHQLAL
uniref:Mitochondrial thiamine pyrophosphate carrier isoform X2 n=1 Tax=Rhizophora mucronata TaxID=61149 RepID=A0A2P2K0F0_RHIMU